MVVNNVLVVGGGTAGWIVASMLAKHLKAGSPDGIKVRLIESPEINIIGVGEGTFPTMRDTLKSLGVAEGDFMRECNATFKQAIKFVDWERAPSGHNHSYYYHLFTPPKRASGIDLTSCWLAANKAHGTSYASLVSLQGHVCDAGLGPKKITTASYDGLLNYAYHLDAVKFTEFLRNFSTRHLGVENLRGTVRQVILRDDGAIDALLTDEYGELRADLYIDCTGFGARLLGDALKVKFIDCRDTLFVDHALVAQVPYEQENSNIPCHTISTAHEAGWTWDIGLSHRRGVGYVYSSRHTTHERAEQVLRHYLGDVTGQQAVRRIPMRVGYREKFWEKNCVAIGLSSGFLEPLESTALVMVEAAAQMLVDLFPRSEAAMPLVAKKFNGAFRYRWERIIDFVKLHYCISHRDDNLFWSDNRVQASIPDSLQEKLALWKMQTPTNHDFPSVYETFNLGSYQYVLYGMHYDTQLAHQGEAHQLLAQQEFLNAANKIHQLKNTLPNHRSLIEKVYAHGFPPV
jgi:tryptophan halogenase